MHLKVFPLLTDGLCGCEASGYGHHNIQRHPPPSSLEGQLHTLCHTSADASSEGWGREKTIQARGKL